MNYTIIAGVNGAGKSTLYNEMSDQDKKKLGERINPDEIAAKIGDHNDPKIQIAAGKEAIRKRNYCMENKISFNQETTLTGKKIIDSISEAKKNGYNVSMHYVNIASSKMAIERVAKRVSMNGHHIPTETIIRRYDESLKNLPKALAICDNAKIYDNTNENHLVFNKFNNQYQTINKIPDWLKEPLREFKNERINILNSELSKNNGELKNIEQLNFKKDNVQSCLKDKEGKLEKLNSQESKFSFKISNKKDNVIEKNNLENDISKLKENLNSINKELGKCRAVDEIKGDIDKCNKEISNLKEIKIEKEKELLKTKEVKKDEQVR